MRLHTSSPTAAVVHPLPISRHCRSLEPHQSALSLAKKDLNWGLHYYQQGQFEKARQKFETALTYAVQAQDTISMGSSLNGLSAVYLQVREYERSLAYSQAAVTILETGTIAAQPEYALAIYQQGISHFKLGNLYAAERCFDQALTIYYTLEDVCNENRVLLHLGQLYAQQEQHLFALAAYEAVLDSLLEYPSQENVGEILRTVLISMMQLCEKTKTGEEKAIASYQSILEQHIPQEQRQQVAQLIQQLGQFHESQEQYSLALECYAQALQAISPVELP